MGNCIKFMNDYIFICVIQLSSILHIQFNVPIDEANEITQTFLHSFRQCPDNADVPLDVWRQHLWNEALTTKYNYLAPEVYIMWLELRYKYLELKPETITLLNRLRGSFNLAIITNGPSNAQWEKLNRLQLNKYFDCILVSADSPWEKPDPQLFYACCNHLCVKPSECVMVGDKLETDIQVRLHCANYQVGIFDLHSHKNARQKKT